MEEGRREPATRDLRRAILEWYRGNARDLPWRRTRDPYAIWISEVMLQQTRVETVRPYYERFLERWPTVQDLAHADPDEVRSAWSGLGYYRRARSMLDAAAAMVERHEGEVPGDPDALAALPGFGPYTTGAVASIAFDHPTPAVDGNVARVLARIFLVEGDVTKGAPARAIRDRATELALGPTPGALAQALIELGALVCKRKPLCGSCPVRASCAARREGRVESVPPPRRRPEKKEVELTALVLVDDAGIVLEPRPEGGLFGGMWCPPLLPGHLAPEEARAAEGLEIGAEALRESGEIEHLLTHRRLRARVLVGPGPRALRPGRRRVPLDALDALGLPSFAVKLLRAGVPRERLPSRLPGRRQEPSNEPQLVLFGGDRAR